MVRSLVLALIRDCLFQPPPGPLAWHVADSATAQRLASIDASKGTLTW